MALNPFFRILVTGDHESLVAAGPKTHPKEGTLIQWDNLPVLSFDRLPISEAVLSQLVEKPFDWIVYTSPRSVKFWTELLLEKGVEVPVETQVACIGESTAEAAANDGFNPDFYPTEPGTEKFLEEFEDLIGNNAMKPSVLIPMAEGGRPTIRERLSELGCGVTAVPLYRTKARPTLKDELVSERVAAASLILFTSPSSVDALLDQITLPGHVKVAAIGKFTAAHLEEKGFGKTPVLPEGDFSRIGEILC